MIFFTADTHFRHSRIIKYCDRPFQSIEEHDNALIKNWNSVVKGNDKVYHLGDFGLGGKKRLSQIIDRLKGKIYFILGGHDKRCIPKDHPKLEILGSYYELTVQNPEGNQRIVLCHYPFLSWQWKHYGSWHLHGHCHGRVPHTSDTRRMDIGVDVTDYTPISYNQVRDILEGGIKK